MQTWQQAHTEAQTLHIYLEITAPMTAPTAAGSHPPLSSFTQTAPRQAQMNSGMYRMARKYTKAGMERRGPGFIIVPEEGWRLLKMDTQQRYHCIIKYNNCAEVSLVPTSCANVNKRTKGKDDDCQEYKENDEVTMKDCPPTAIKVPFMDRVQN